MTESKIGATKMLKMPKFRKLLAGTANMLNKVRETREYSIVVYGDGIATEVVRR